MINKDLIYNAKAKFLLASFILIYALSSGAIAPQGIGSGFAKTIGLNESTNLTLGSGFAESIDGNESNATRNESLNATINASSNVTSNGIGSGFAKSIEINQSITVSGRDFSNMIK